MVDSGGQSAAMSVRCTTPDLLANGIDEYKIDAGYLSYQSPIGFLKRVFFFNRVGEQLVLSEMKLLSRCSHPLFIRCNAMSPILRIHQVSMYL